MDTCPTSIIRVIRVSDTDTLFNIEECPSLCDVWFMNSLMLVSCVADQRWLSAGTIRILDLAAGSLVLISIHNRFSSISFLYTFFG